MNKLNRIVMSITLLSTVLGLSGCSVEDQEQAEQSSAGGTQAAEQIEVKHPIAGQLLESAKQMQESARKLKQVLEQANMKEGES